MDLVISVDIVAKILLDIETSRGEVCEKIYDKISEVASSGNVWIYSASLLEIESEFNSNFNPQKKSEDSGECVAINFYGALNRFIEAHNIQILASLSGDYLLNNEQRLNPQNICIKYIMLENALKRLEKKSTECQAFILTDDSTAKAQISSKFILNSEDFLAKKIKPREVNFIDLQKQQALLRPELEEKIFNVLQHGQYILGKEVAEFEAKAADFVGVKNCVSVASGTDSLLVAMMALKIGKIAGGSLDDEVITVPYTWISTAEMIAAVGAKPVFVDIDERTFNLDASLLESAITAKTRAIMPVSLYGQCAEMDKICSIAEKHNLPVIEDAAQSFGATFNGKKSCALSEIGSTSFFPSKPLGCYGEGGAVFTDDDELAETMCQLRNHGQAKKHRHSLIGLNARFDTLQAGVALAKFGVFENECRLRQKVANFYDKEFADLAKISTPFIAKGCESVYAQYTILAEDRDSLQVFLQKEKIPAVAYYIVPLHLQPCFAYLGYREGDFPVAERIGKKCLSLPMSPYISESELELISEKIKVWHG